MSSKAELARAKRRHKVLLRELAALAAKNTTDSLIEGELQKLELAFPELRQETEHQQPTLSTSATIDAAVALPSSPSLTATAPLDVLATSNDAVSEAASRIVRSESLVAAALPQSSQMCGSSSATDSQEQESLSSKGPVPMDGFSLWIIRVYTAAHHRSLFGPLNFIKVFVSGCLIAVAHCFVVDPCSELGACLQPSFVCLMIHVSNLYSLFLRRRDVLSVPMLLVYFCLDAVPSVAVAIVSYSLTLCILTICGAPRLPIACL